MSTAPARVDAAAITAAVDRRHFEVLQDGETTICVLTLDNGLQVRGDSTFGCPETFQRGDNRAVAQARAEREVARLLAFRLADTQAAAAGKQLVLRA